MSRSDWKSKLVRSCVSTDCLTQTGVLLSISRSNGYETLASKLGYGHDAIAAFRLNNSGNPGRALLEDWQTRESTTVRVLLTMLEQMQRDDVVKLLEDHVKDPHGVLVIMIDKKSKCPAVSLSNTMGEVMRDLLANDDDLRLYVADRDLELVGTLSGEIWNRTARECMGQQLDFRTVWRSRSNTNPPLAPRPQDSVPIRTVRSVDQSDEDRKATRFPSHLSDYEPLLPRIRASIPEAVEPDDQGDPHGPQVWEPAGWQRYSQPAETPLEGHSSGAASGSGGHRLDDLDSMDSLSLHFLTVGDQTDAKRRDSFDGCSTETSSSVAPRRQNTDQHQGDKRLGIRYDSEYDPTAEPSCPESPNQADIAPTKTKFIRSESRPDGTVQDEPQAPPLSPGPFPPGESDVLGEGMPSADETSVNEECSAKSETVNVMTRENAKPQAQSSSPGTSPLRSDSQDDVLEHGGSLVTDCAVARCVPPTGTVQTNTCTVHTGESDDTRANLNTKRTSSGTSSLNQSGVAEQCVRRDLATLEAARQLPGYHEEAVEDPMIQTILAIHIMRLGAYILRPSRTMAGAVCISVTHLNRHRHEIVSFRVHEMCSLVDGHQQISYYLFDNGPVFTTLDDLIKHYRTFPMSTSGNADSGPRLRVPVKKK